MTEPQQRLRAPPPASIPSWGGGAARAPGRDLIPAGVLRPLPGGPTMAATPIGRSTMSEQTTNAPPIVLIHGLWMTARSWDRWVEYYRAKGHEGHRADVPGIRDRGGGAA